MSETEINPAHALRYSALEDVYLEAARVLGKRDFYRFDELHTLAVSSVHSFKEINPSTPVYEVDGEVVTAGDAQQVFGKYLDTLSIMRRELERQSKSPVKTVLYKAKETAIGQLTQEGEGDLYVTRVYAVVGTDVTGDASFFEYASRTGIEDIVEGKREFFSLLDRLQSGICRILEVEEEGEIRYHHDIPPGEAQSRISQAGVLIDEGVLQSRDEVYFCALLSGFSSLVNAISRTELTSRYHEDMDVAILQNASGIHSGIYAFTEGKGAISEEQAHSIIQRVVPNTLAPIVAGDVTVEQLEGLQWLVEEDSAKVGEWLTVNTFSELTGLAKKNPRAWDGLAYAVGRSGIAPKTTLDETFSQEKKQFLLDQLDALGITRNPNFLQEEYEAIAQSYNSSFEEKTEEGTREKNMDASKVFIATRILLARENPETKKRLKNTHGELFITDRGPQDLDNVFSGFNIG